MLPQRSGGASAHPPAGRAAVPAANVRRKGKECFSNLAAMLPQLTDQCAALLLAVVSASAADAAACEVEGSQARGSNASCIVDADEVLPHVSLRQLRRVRGGALRPWHNELRREHEMGAPVYTSWSIWRSSVQTPELERLPHLLHRRPSGIGLGGGGTRSAILSMGYLRALSMIGALDQARYISTVSGSAWTAVPYLYYQKGNVDDFIGLSDLAPPMASEELRAYVETAKYSPFELSFQDQSKYSPGISRIINPVIEGRPPETGFKSYVYNQFLKRAGIGMKDMFAIDEDHKRRLESKLGSRGFRAILPLPNMPYLSMGAVILGPSDIIPFKNLHGMPPAFSNFQITPLHTGTHVQEVRLFSGGTAIGGTTVYKIRMLLGGYIETPGFGSTYSSHSSAASEYDEEADAPTVTRCPFTITDAVTVTSYAPSAWLATTGLRTGASFLMRYWAPDEAFADNKGRFLDDGRESYIKGPDSQDGWCLPYQHCFNGDCCAEGSSCNTCEFGFRADNHDCAGKGNRRCNDHSNPTSRNRWCLPHQTCRNGDCCAAGSSCKSCQHGWVVDNSGCPGKGNRRCKWAGENVKRHSWAWETKAGLNDGPNSHGGWCLPHQVCHDGDCCAEGTSCNTCQRGWHVDNDGCEGKGNRRCATGSGPIENAVAIGDGGTIENFPLLELIAKGVRCPVMFGNFYTDLDKDYNPYSWYLNEDSPVNLDVYAFFHDPGPRADLEGYNYRKNAIFPGRDWRKLVAAWREKEAEGRPLIATLRHVTIENKHWNIPAGREVFVTWVYNSPSERFHSNFFRSDQHRRDTLNRWEKRFKYPFPLADTTESLESISPDLVRLLYLHATMLVLDEQETFKAAVECQMTQEPW